LYVREEKWKREMGTYAAPFIATATFCCFGLESYVFDWGRGCGDESSG